MREEEREMPEKTVMKELRFKQIAVVGGAKQVVGAPTGMTEWETHLYGLTEDGRVYYLHERGWAPMEMKSTES